MRRWGCALAMMLLVGCGQPPAGVAVRGRVSYRGLPVRVGMIAFTPDPARGGRGPTALGRLGSDGAYHLEADGHAAIAPGWYRVTVASSEPVAVGLPLPERLRDPELSGLLREVVAGRENVLDFLLDAP